MNNVMLIVVCISTNRSGTKWRDHASRVKWTRKIIIVSVAHWWQFTTIIPPKTTTEIMQEYNFTINDINNCNYVKELMLFYHAVFFWQVNSTWCNIIWKGYFWGCFGLTQENVEEYIDANVLSTVWVHLIQKWQDTWPTKLNGANPPMEHEEYIIQQEQTNVRT